MRGGGGKRKRERERTYSYISAELKCIYMYIRSAEAKKQYVFDIMEKDTN